MRKAISTIMALVLAVGLCPGAALAQADLSAGASGALSAQASGKTSMWVVAKATVPANGGVTSMQTYSYDGNGLLKKAKFGTAGAVGSTATLKYSGTKLTTLTMKTSYAGGSSSTKISTKYDKAGRLSKRTGTMKYSYSGGSTSSKASETYSYDAKGRLAKRVCSRDSVTTTYEYKKFDSADRALVEVSDTNGSKVRTAYKYDGHGNLTKVGDASFSMKYDKKGRLASKVMNGWGTYTYAYKKVSVPKNAVAAVKAQQLKILNTEMPTYELEFNIA